MLLGLKRKRALFLINHVYQGTNPKYWEKKRKLLNSIGHAIGEGTKIVGPVRIYGKLQVGKNVWLGENFTVYGLGTVRIGDNCDVAPDVVCLTGSHEIGGPERRAGKGTMNDLSIGNGCWVCARSTLIGPLTISDSSVIAAGSVVNRPVDENTLVGGVPAKVIRTLE